MRYVACLPATAAWVVVIDVGNCYNGVHGNWDIREVHTAGTLLRCVPTAAVKWGAEAILWWWASGDSHSA